MAWNLLWSSNFSSVVLETTHIHSANSPTSISAGWTLPSMMLCLTFCLRTTQGCSIWTFRTRAWYAKWPQTVLIVWSRAAGNWKISASFISVWRMTSWPRLRNRKSHACSIYPSCTGVKLNTLLTSLLRLGHGLSKKSQGCKSPLALTTPVRSTESAKWWSQKSLWWCCSWKPSRASTRKWTTQQPATTRLFRRWCWTPGTLRSSAEPWCAWQKTASGCTRWWCTACWAKASLIRSWSCGRRLGVEACTFWSPGWRKGRGWWEWRQTGKPRTDWQRKPRGQNGWWVGTDLVDRVGGGSGRAGLGRGQSGWWVGTDLVDRVGGGSGRAGLGNRVGGGSGGADVARWLSGWWVWQGRPRWQSGWWVWHGRPR